MLVILVQTVFKIRKNKIVGLTTSTNKTLKQCKWCGRLFTLKNNHQLYCNTTCKTYMLSWILIRKEEVYLVVPC